MNKYKNIEIAKEDERYVADYQEGYTDGQTDGFQEGYISGVEDFYNGYLKFRCEKDNCDTEENEWDNCFVCYKKLFDKNMLGE